MGRKITDMICRVRINWASSVRPSRACIHGRWPCAGRSPIKEGVNVKAESTRRCWKCIPSVVGAVPRLEVGTSKTLGRTFIKFSYLTSTLFSSFHNKTFKI